MIGTIHWTRVTKYVQYFLTSVKPSTQYHISPYCKLWTSWALTYILRWIRSYLLYRSQFIAVEGCNSCTIPVVSGVPQGSILGPHLFICYISDVPLTISGGSEINLFADDIVLYRIIKAPIDYDHLQHDIDHLILCVRKTSQI